jgi:hypothetical protein
MDLSGRKQKWFISKYHHVIYQDENDEPFEQDKVYFLLKKPPILALEQEPSYHIKPQKSVVIKVLDLHWPNLSAH